MLRNPPWGFASGHHFPGACAQWDALLSVFPFPLLSIPVRGVGVGLLLRCFPPAALLSSLLPAGPEPAAVLAAPAAPASLAAALEQVSLPWCPLQKVLPCGCGRSSLGGLHGAASSARGSSSARGAPAASSSEGCSEISPPGDPDTAGWDGRSCVQAQEVSHPVFFPAGHTGTRLQQPGKAQGAGSKVPAPGAGTGSRPRARRPPAP